MLEADFPRIPELLGRAVAPRCRRQEPSRWRTARSRNNSVSSSLPPWSVITASPEETEALAARLAAHLRPGDIVAVSGELGAGKTTFVRGAARALGVSEPVSSPTFTIGHRYEAPTPVAHLDLYRIAGLDPEEWGDLEPYFDGTVAFVEWPEHGATGSRGRARSLRSRHVDESHRRVRIDE